MRLTGTKQYSAFDGQLVFSMLPKRALKMIVADYELRRAFPAAYADRSSMLLLKALRFVGCFELTWDIEFHFTADTPDELRVFKDWYTQIVPRADYRETFESYIACVTEDIEAAWVAALEATRAPLPTAPEEIKPGAAERAASDPNFTNAEREPSAKLASA